MKKIAVLNDLSGMGKCSLTAAIPVISVMGIQACPLPTAVLSAQTGFPSYYCDDYTDRMDAIMEEWKKMDFYPDGIYTGFLADARQADKAVEFIEQFAKEMFRAGSNLKDKSPEEIFYQDYKKFIGEGNVSFGVGQISSMDSEELKEIKEKLMPFMVSECGRHDITRVYFMLTNILEESTELLFYGEGSQQMAEIAFERKPDGDTFSLPGVVSRKKQLIPAMMEAAQLMNSDYA